MKIERSFHRGFTIVELIIVVAVIALLASIVAVGYGNITRTARDKSLLSDIDSVEAEIVRYSTKHAGQYGPVLNWNSDSGTNVNIGFMPTVGNTIVVSASEDGYCIRAYNPASSNSTLISAVEKGSLCSVTWKQVGAGGVFTCGVSSTDAAYCWGSNSSGQLGGGTTVTSYTPVAVAVDGALANKTITSLAVGGTNHVCAIASDNLAYCWGANSSGQLGKGATSSTESKPVAVSRAGVLAGKTIKSLSSGNSSTCAIASDNLAYCWGANSSGQLGNTLTSNSSSAVAVSRAGVLSGKTFKSVSVGGSFACAVASDNLAYCWGDNAYGQLGDTTTTNSSEPVAVSTAGVLSGKTVKSVVAGGSHACAVASDNKVYCWGNNTFGRLGDGTSSSSSSEPVATVWTGVLSGKTAKSISTAPSGGHTCLIASNNLPYCWGQNSSGQLGNNATATSVTSPVTTVTTGALSGKTLSAISVNGSHSCGVASDLNIYCWGSNSNGRLGDGTTTSSTVPTLTLTP